MDHRRTPQSATAVVLVRLDGSIASWDAGARRIFGREPEDVLGLPLCMLFAEECRDAVDALWRATPAEPLCLGATACDCDGVWFEVDLTASRTLAVRNGATGLVAIVRDVTEQRAAENALLACTGAHDSASVLRAIAETLQRWVPLTKLSLGDGSAHVQACVPLVSDGRPFATLDAGFSDPRMPTPRVMRLLRAVGEAVGPSIARMLELEEKSRAIGQLQQIDRLEKEFLALITHDMRTPLAVIAGVAGNLRDKWEQLPDAERLEELDAILRNGRSLARLVEQDLQLALVDAGRLAYEIRPFDITDDINRIVSDFARAADTHVSLCLEGPLPLVRADPQRNAQVLANLLSNAVKFSPAEATVEVEAHQRAGMVYLSVRDHGCGLSQAASSKLFHKFSRLGPDGAARVAGTGLGLYLSKCMVEAQGGRIWADSRPGRGATFTYTLPVAVGATNGTA